MRNRITVWLDKDLAAWLEAEAARIGVSQGKVIRDQLEKVKTRSAAPPFIRLAGAVQGPQDLSRRKGFAHRDPRGRTFA